MYNDSGRAARTCNVGTVVEDVCAPVGVAGHPTSRILGHKALVEHHVEVAVETVHPRVQHSHGNRLHHLDGLQGSIFGAVCGQRLRGEERRGGEGMGQHRQTETDAIRGWCHMHVGKHRKQRGLDRPGMPGSTQIPNPSCV